MAEEITITRALVELKTLQQRIENTIASTSFVGVKLKGAVQNTTKSEADFSKDARAAVQKIHDLITRRNIIKAAIVMSNAQTNVTVGGVDYTVAEAIERKNSINFEQQAINAVRSQFQNCMARVENINAKADVQLNNTLSQAVSGERSSGISEEELAVITKVFREGNQASIVDPIDAAKFIEETESAVLTFLSDVDFALSEINAVTKITV